jgi:hypothetical protein
MSLVLILHVFAHVGFIEDHFFLLSTDSTYSCVPGDKGGSFFFQT